MKEVKKLHKANKLKELFVFLVPWLGFGLMQSMNIPNVIQALKTGQSMPVASLVMLIAALCCYLFDSVRRRCKLHIVSSSIGIISNTTVLVFVW